MSRFRSIVGRAMLATALLLGCQTASSAQTTPRQPLRIYAAGSLASSFSDLLTAFGTPPATAVQATYGPAGALRERLEHGETAELFASADMAQPRRLAQGGHKGSVVMFARNRMCAIGRSSLGLTPANLLSRLLDPAVKLATSTPGADPSGDYAWAIFKRADGVHPGATAMLEDKAQQLLGHPGARALVPGHSAAEGVFLSGRADVLIGYCSGASVLRNAVPDLVAVQFPQPLDVSAPYGLIVLSGNPIAMRFALFILSDAGQTILAQHGLIPVTLSGTHSP
ncbi:solute-binding protein [Lichenicola cladoniae]|uniref:Solute-binding protein n=1 Tax=Lichenicola cladoniae TaxID=1484109 RepID=A0A6M8HNN8_9PROT|nr:substrate-binding domain-containing protein [Lichenicola cladoniae]NPD67448.1 solute-binding protein [Acetobacteraceae bacterium]QKE89936.1 solute-binding protein [Lichenicola cladoniae]